MKGVVSAVPGVGAPIAEIIGLVTAVGFQRRMDDWYQSVVEAIEDVQDRVEDLEGLQSDPEFLDMLVATTRAAQATSREEKLHDDVGIIGGTHMGDASPSAMAVHHQPTDQNPAVGIEGRRHLSKQVKRVRAHEQPPQAPGQPPPIPAHPPTRRCQPSVAPTDHRASVR